MISYDSALTVIEEVKKAVVGKDEVIRKVMAAILAQGHILIDDIPGVGKTTMALAFAKAMNLRQKRLQFTPDVLPSDITGYFMYNYQENQFQYVEGPIMCELFLADEINRTSPKTQSALLEVMEERRVTLDGHTLEVPNPFVVIATQNPTGSAGTQALPDSQVDRFMICLQMGYPDAENEINILKQRVGGQPIEAVEAAIGKTELMELQKLVQEIYISDSVYNYMVELVAETRTHSMVKLGVSPRGSLALARMSQSIAFLNGRDYVIPEDVGEVFKDVAIHRMILHARAKVNKLSAADILEEILKKTEEPKTWKPRAAEGPVRRKGIKG